MESLKMEGQHIKITALRIIFLFFMLFSVCTELTLVLSWPEFTRRVSEID